MHVDTPQRFCHLFRRPSLKHVPLKTKGKAHPSGLATKLGTTLSMRSNFHEWVQALETELNRCRAAPTEAEVRVLLRHSVHVDLQGAVTDACIVKGEMAPSVVVWFDELVSYVYTSFRRAQDFCQMSKMVLKEEAWAEKMEEVVRTLMQPDQPLYEYSEEFTATVVFDYLMSANLSLLGSFRTGLKAKNYMFPLEHGDFLKNQAGVQRMVLYADFIHARQNPSDHLVEPSCRSFTAWEEKQTSPCSGCSTAVIGHAHIEAGYTCFWKQPKLGRPGYLMIARVVRLFSENILVLQDGYSHLTAFVKVMEDEDHHEEAFLNAARFVMGKLPQVLIFNGHSKWRKEAHVIYPKLCRKHQIIYHVMSNPTQHSCDSLCAALEVVMEPHETIARDRFISYNLRRFQDTINYHPSLIGGVSPFERHFNTPPPVEYEKGSVQGHAQARQFLYGVPGEIETGANEAQPSPFPALALLSGIRPQKISTYGSYWDKNFVCWDGKLFEELRAAVDHCGVLLQDIKAGDLVLYSYIDIENTKKILREDSECYFSKLSKPQQLFLAANPPSIAKDAGHAGHKVYKKGTNQPRPPFLAPLKVLAVTQSEGKSKRFKLETTGPRRVMIKNVPHECLRRYEAGIQLTFRDWQWPSEVTF